MPVVSITHNITQDRAVLYVITLPKKFRSSPITGSVNGLSPLKLVVWGPKYQTRRLLGNYANRQKLLNNTVLADVNFGGGLRSANRLDTTNVTVKVIVLQG